MADNLVLNLALLNLGVARAASLQLDADLACNPIDICVINEPYAPERDILHFSNRLKILAYKDDMPKVAVIINNLNIKYFLLFCTQSIVSANIIYKGFDIVITGIYCSPSGDISSELNSLEFVHRKFGHKPHIILGDFNAKSPLWGNRPLDNRGSEVIDFVDRNDLMILNEPDSIPTFDSSRGQSWIDLCITNDRTFRYNFRVDDRITNSDHNIIELTVYTDKEQVSQDMRIFKLYRWLELKVKVKSVIEEISDKDFDHSNIGDIINWVQDHILIDCTHIKSADKKKNRNAYWWNGELCSIRSKVRAMRRRYQKELNSNLREELKIKYKRAFASYKRKIIRTKRETVKQYLTSVVNSFGGHFKLISDKRKVGLELVRVRKLNGDYTDSRQDTIEEILAYHFPNTGDRRNEIPNLDWDDRDITHVEVVRAIAESKLGKSPGIDGIPFEVIREIYYANKEWFLRILNTCYLAGIFPNIWKRAKVVLLPKKGKDLSTCSAYRPICLLPCWGKLFDKIIKNRLIFYLEEKGLIDEKQFGFRKGRSTEDALSNIVKRIKENINNKEISLLVSLDFKSAFNSVNVNILISKIIELDIPNTLKRILIDFCINRKVAIDNVELDYDTGVPQGSSLGPILWNIYINEILKINMEGALLQAFADDLILVVNEKASYRFTTSVNRLLDRMYNWIREHKLVLNFEKCEFIMVYKGKRITHIPSIKIDNNKIRFVTELKYLGVIFDEKMTWVKHVNYMKDKVINFQFRVNRISRATWGLRGSVLKETYEAVIEKYILYGASIWFNETVRVRDKIKQAQRSALIAMVKAYRTVPTDAVNVLAGVIPIDIKARYTVLYRELYKEGKNVIIGDKSLNSGSLEIENREFIEPWTDITLSWHFSNSNGFDYEVYTDGSRIDNKVGCAYVVVNKGNYIYNEKYRLQDGNTVYQAEAWALLRAVHYIKNADMEVNEIGVFSDSRSVLQAIGQLDSKNKIIREIQEEVARCTKKIIFHWVKAHIGIQHNEEADRLAKEATSRPEVDVDLGLTRIQVKSLIYKESIRNWQEEWNQSSKGRRTFKFIPKVSTDRCIADFYINQVLTGHGVFPVYQSRFHGKDDRCFCSQSLGTVEHIIYDCDLFNNIRINHFPVNYKNIELYSLCKEYRIGICSILHELLSMYIV